MIFGVLMTTSAIAEYKNQVTTKGAASMGFLDTLSVAKKILIDSNRTPKSKLPEIQPDFSVFLETSEKMKFIWFGHSTFLLNLDDQLVLIDPVFHHASPFSFLVNRFQAPVVTLDKLPKVDTIVISHDHYDHLDKLTIEFYKNSDVKFLVPKGVGRHLKGWGIAEANIKELNWHESVTVNDIHYKAAPAQHFSGRGLFDRNETLWASWIIEGKSEKVYYSGDSGYGPHFKEIGQKDGPFDYAFLENGQYNIRWPDVHMQPEETLQALIDLEAKVLIPAHWGMFDLSLHHWTEPIVRTHTIAKNWDLPILTPRLGEIVDQNNRPTLEWWKPYIEEQQNTITAPQVLNPKLVTK